ncbi:MAG: gamma-glutamylputrescine oxidase [Chlamydiales bacterium]|jgi:gamma-glutamylputrescine oxidase
MSLSVWQDSNKKENLYADILIVGAGITGISLAFWIGQHDPSIRILIVDKNEIGSGATGRNAGFLTTGSVGYFMKLTEDLGEEKAIAYWKFSEENHRLLLEHVIQDDQSLHYERQGSFSLATDDASLQELLATEKIMRQAGINLEAIGAEILKKEINVEGFIGAVKYPKDGVVHPVKMLDKMKNMTGNLQIKENSIVYQVDTDSSKVKVLTPDYIIETPTVIYACNGYLPGIDSYFQEKVTAEKGQILMTEPADPCMKGTAYERSQKIYFRQLPKGELLIGGARECDDRSTANNEISDKVQGALEDFIQMHLPSFQRKKVIRRWAGVMGFTESKLPLMGHLPEDSRIYFVGGYTGHGMGLAFNSAKSLVEHILHGKTLPSTVIQSL